MKQGGLLCWVSYMTIAAVSCYSGSDINDVYTKLMTTDGYNKKIRPLINQSSSIYIVADFYLNSIIEFNEKDESLKTSGFLSCSWTDEYLTWNATAYNDVNKIFLPQDDVWKPDISLSNAFKTFSGLGSSYLNVAVMSSGSVTWEPFQVLESTCSVDTTYFPFDVQECEIKFTAWSYTRSELDINLGNNGVSLDEYSPNAAWALHSTSYKEINTAEAAVIFLIRLQRKPLFYLVNVLLPVIFLSILNVLSFCLPCESGERAGYGITVFLSLAVFLTIIATELPKNSDNMSYVSTYLAINCVLSTLIVAASLMQLRLSTRTDKHHMNRVYKTIVKFYNIIRCRRSKVSACSSEKVEKIPDSTSDVTSEEPVYTWHQVVNALDFFFFWLSALTTVLSTIIIFSILVTYEFDIGNDPNTSLFIDYDY